MEVLYAIPVIKKRFVYTISKTPLIVATCADISFLLFVFCLGRVSNLKSHQISLV
jgi:hypothetical protein